MAVAGGLQDPVCTPDCGTVYRITPRGVFSTIYDFCSQTNCAGGYIPDGIVQDTNGNLYGTTGGGGTEDSGIFFSLATPIGAFVKTLPSVGAAGATVTIYGTGLSGATAVQFNKTAASFKVVSDNVITTSVPAAATSGPVTVTVPGHKLTSFPNYVVVTPSLTQTITFGALSDKPVNSPPFPVSATASSELPVSFASTTASTCSVSGDTVTLLAGGRCAIKATQAGNAYYKSARAVTQAFTITKLAQPITFGALPSKTLGDPPFTVSATASSGLAVGFASTTTTVCTVSGNTVTLVASGHCGIRASQAGDGSYAAAMPVVQGFQVKP